MSSSNTVYLITGANRGIGQGLAATYLSRPRTTVIAAVRDPSHPTSKSLSSLPKGPDSILIILKLDSASETDGSTAISSLPSQYGISHLDVVIANAGMGTDMSTVATVPLEAYKQHIAVNATGPLLLFQACLPLLQRSKQQQGGKFVTVGSPLGSLNGMEQRPYPSAAYGPSKAVLHWLTRKIHFENGGLVAFVVDPGFVQTDMGNAGARSFGLKEATTPVEESVAGVVKVIDGATREKTSGCFPTWDGGEFPW